MNRWNINFGGEMKCDGCDDYDERMERVVAPEVFMQTTRPSMMDQFPSEWVFGYCPWCSTRLRDNADIPE